MTTATIGQRNARQFSRQASTHYFAVGQSVRLKSRFGPTPADIYHVTGTLPPRGNSPQYRIRNDAERHERMTTQDDLEPVDVSQSGASLIERTFGHGQRTETKQSRAQKAEAGKGSAQA
ncbi:hypothetical protein C7I84_24880 [Mesorhizobium ephedrae]|uniref:Uncharacterized protein n=1 Tax=Kumtagia ephedrae TaxID=2116701 RepID=A0A2P7RVH4_9HYPH|nr:hypothetical protein C7I84_24880 [Mesorhizobium ephedrae]